MSMRLLSLRKSKEGPPGEAGSEPVVAQARSLGRRNWFHIGTGRQGPIELDFYQPQQPDKLLGLNETTGETVFVASQAAEKASNGLHANDFPDVKSGTLGQSIDRATVSGAQIENVKHSARERWPIEQEADPESSLKQVALGGFQTNLGERYRRRLNAWERLQKIRQDAKKRREQTVDDGVRF